MGRPKKIGRVHPATGVIIYQDGTCSVKTVRRSYGYIQYYRPIIGKMGVITGYKYFLLHRHVAEMFVPNPDNKPIVNHIDGNKGNANYSNLEWVTHQENCLHAHRLGLNKRKLTEKDVKEIRKSKAPAHLLCFNYNVSEQTIVHVRKRITWRGVH